MSNKYGDIEKINVIKELIGKSFVSVKNIDDQELVFTDANGDRYIFYHEQNCCESVEIEDICGELSYLENSPLTMAEEFTHEKVLHEEMGLNDDNGYRTMYTFYKFATRKGYVIVRWYGMSNGWYSEAVNFKIVRAGEDSIKAAEELWHKYTLGRI